mgnify:CR=1 FL=1
MNIIGQNGLNSLKIKNKNTLCDNWYTVFRRVSRIIQEEKLRANAKVAGCLHEKGRNYGILICKGNR